MAQQTAVEWLVNELKSYTFHKRIDMAEWEELKKLSRKAKQMEKEQHQETFKQSRQAKIFEEGMPPVWESFDEYYNETYNKE